MYKTYHERFYIENIYKSVLDTGQKSKGSVK